MPQSIMDRNSIAWFFLQKFSQQVDRFLRNIIRILDVTFLGEKELTRMTLLRSSYISGWLLPSTFGGENGPLPTKISYTRIPNVQQSSFSLCPFSISISGARYSGVPQKVFLTLSLRFDQPKSVILSPSSVKRIFSSLRSR